MNDDESESWLIDTRWFIIFIIILIIVSYIAFKSGQRYNAMNIMLKTYSDKRTKSVFNKSSTLSFMIPLPSFYNFLVKNIHHFFPGNLQFRV